jgi:hypothetical protein
MFTVTTNYVAYWTGVRLTGAYNGVDKHTDLTVIPSASLSLVSVSVDPTSIKGGTTVMGTVTLSTPAPAGGMPVEMWTTGAAAYVPFIVTVPAGFTTGTFAVQTVPVPSNTSDIVVAFYNGTIQTAPVTVTP